MKQNKLLRERLAHEESLRLEKQIYHGSFARHVPSVGLKAADLRQAKRPWWSLWGTKQIRQYIIKNVVDYYWIRLAPR